MSHRITVLGRATRVRGVRSLEAAFGAFSVAEYGAWVAILVYAYERGGATESAIAAVCQLLPAAFVAPMAARAIDRHGPASALRRGYWTQAVAYGATAALLFAGAPAVAVYTAAVIAASAVTATRPAHAAMVPLLAADSEGVTALTVLSGWVESTAVLVGPAMAGLLLALDGPPAAIACFAAALTVAAMLVTHAFATQRARPMDAGADHAGADDAGQPGIACLIRDHGQLVPLVLLVATQYLVIGALDVLLVVLAIAELGLGASGAGYLTAAFGAGGVMGSAGAVWLIGRRRLAGPLSVAAIGWGSALALLGVWPTVAGAFLLLGVAGSARSLLDTSGRTILLRVTPRAVRGQVFGLLEGASMLALATGSALVPAFVALGGPRTALIATGGLLCAITVTAGAAIHAVDRSDVSYMRAFTRVG
jgi:hypothetical protein